MIPLLCPNCKKVLFREEKRFLCENGHSFDLARQGYVNLLTGSSTHSHGDDREMVRARRAFLAKGYYRPLLEALCRRALEILPQNAAILDAGCGEGYYTKGILDAAEKASLLPRFAGVDISKNAVSYCAGAIKGHSFAVASVFELPFAAESFDLILSLFAPYSEAEFLRVLKPGGFLLRAVPEAKHLFSLKKAVYENPYENEKSAEIGAGFEEICTERLFGEMELKTNEDIRNLFAMTPYAHKTSPRDRAKLEALSELKTEYDFGILLTRKK